MYVKNVIKDAHKKKKKSLLFLKLDIAKAVGSLELYSGSPTRFCLWTEVA
jgi:hypothetical protein